MANHSWSIKVYFCLKRYNVPRLQRRFLPTSLRITSMNDTINYHDYLIEDENLYETQLGHSCNTKPKGNFANFYIPPHERIPTIYTPFQEQSSGNVMIQIQGIFAPLSIEPARSRIHHSKCKFPEIQHYLIRCAYLIFVRKDERRRDKDGRLVDLNKFGRKSHVSSDISQKDLETIYFRGMERSSKSRSKSFYTFQPPDWSLWEPYLFPWIHRCEPDLVVPLMRKLIKHMAFCIWEYFTIQGKVTIKEMGNNKDNRDVRLGNVRGWWLESDGDRPLNYLSWRVEYDGSIPSGLILVFLWIVKCNLDITRFGFYFVVPSLADLALRGAGGYCKRSFHGRSMSRAGDTPCIYSRSVRLFLVFDRNFMVWFCVGKCLGTGPFPGTTTENLQLIEAMDKRPDREETRAI